MSSIPYFPDPPPATGRTVSGGTVGGGGVITATTTTVTITRTVTPLFIGGTAGRLVWAADVTADRAITAVVFRMTAGTPRTAATRPGAPASAVLELPGSDTPAQLQIVVTCPNGTVLTVTDRWVQDVPDAQPLVPARTGFADASPNGAPTPAPSAGLPAREADSPARRSPQVRAAQSAGGRRPDLLARQNSLIG